MAKAIAVEAQARIEVWDRDLDRIHHLQTAGRLTTTEPYQFRVMRKGGHTVIQSFARQGGVHAYVGLVDITAVMSNPRARLVARRCLHRSSILWH